MRNNKQVLLTLLAIIVIATVIYAVWSAVMKSSPAVTGENGTGTICTLDAKECPDGSWVGRSGPNCHFVCPIPVSTSTQPGSVISEVKLNQRVTPIAEAITVTEVVEDSRCPLGVQCIQAGTVRVRVKIESGMGTANEIFSIGRSITTETEEMTLIAVRPEAEEGKKIEGEEYTFIFRSVKR